MILARRLGLAREYAAEAIVVSALFCYVVVCGWLAYVNDDAFITFRYSRSLAEHLRPFFNPGERVEGYTSPLMMMLITAAIRVSGEVGAVIAAKCIGLFSGACALFFAVRLWKDLQREQEKDQVVTGSRFFIVAALLLVAVDPGFSVNSVNGLETTLFSALVTAGVWLGMQSMATGKWRGAGIAFALAALTRPEGAVVFALYWSSQATSHLIVALLRRSRSLSRPDHSRFWRHLVADATIVIVAVGLLIAARLLIYGDWLPNTYYAKEGSMGGDGVWKYLATGALLPFLGVFGVGSAAVGLLLSRRLLALLPIVGVAIGGLGLVFITGIDWMVGSRFVVPYLPLAGVLVGLGWWELGRRLWRRRPWILGLFVLTTVPGSLILQGDARRELSKYIQTRARGYRGGHAALANWLCGKRVPPRATIALMDIGIIGFRCAKQRILDITGLTDRHIGHSPGRFLKKRYDPNYIFAQKPEFIVLVFGAPLAPGANRRIAPPRLFLFSDIERRIAAHPAFRAHYQSPRLVEHGGWLAKFAGSVGARHVFLHQHPSAWYLLAAFERRAK